MSVDIPPPIFNTKSFENETPSQNQNIDLSLNQEIQKNSEEPNNSSENNQCLNCNKKIEICKKILNKITEIKNNDDDDEFRLGQSRGLAQAGFNIIKEYDEDSSFKEQFKLIKKIFYDINLVFAFDSNKKCLGRIIGLAQAGLNMLE